jgi:hypothetical protein
MNRTISVQAGSPSLNNQNGLEFQKIAISVKILPFFPNDPSKPFRSFPEKI